MDFDLTQAMAVLERTPGALRALLSGLPDAWTRANEGPDTWSPFDVVGHLIDGEESLWMVRARVILTGGDDRRFEPFDRFRHLRVNRDRSLEELLERFEECRAENLAELRALELTGEDLERTGQHPELGRVTLTQLLSTWVARDLGHIAQVSRVMARGYREVVGPWEAYLPVLHR